MYRDSAHLTKTSQVLMYLLAAGSLVEAALMFGRLRNGLYPEYAKYKANRRMESLVNRLYNQGWLKVEYKEAKRVIKLTRQGELEALFQKAHLEKHMGKWDGKWRIAIFDIPEQTREIRAQLRKLLRDFGFKALQASVYVYPFALNVNAMEFLKKSGLMRYLRFARIDAFDDDTDLRRQFKDVIRKTDGRQKDG